MTDGEWKRPALWTPGSDPEPVLTDLPGDIVPVACSPDGQAVLLRQDFRARNELHLLDLPSGQLTRLATPPGALVQRTDCQLVDRDQALVVWSDSARPSRSILVGAEGSSDALPSLTSEFAGPDWQEVIFPSTDGSEIQGWLLVPDDREGPSPTVVYTHGGPTAVHQPVFSRLCQAWVDEGFALLSVNYRGSTTFGDAFRESLTGL